MNLPILTDAPTDRSRRKSTTTKLPNNNESTVAIADLTVRADVDPVTCNTSGSCACTTSSSAAAGTTLMSTAAGGRNNIGNMGRRKHYHNPDVATRKTTRSCVLLALALTGCCWFGSLGYTHYKLGLIESQQMGIQAPPTRRKLLRMEPALFDMELERDIAAFKAEQEKALSLTQEAEDDDDVRTGEHRFLIFEGDMLPGQGAGNLMNGLLATHLLAEEFNRTVCVIPDYDFHLGFELIDPLTTNLCKKFFREKVHYDEPVDRIELVNFMHPPDECRLQKMLASEEKKTLYVQANTYPRWCSVPPNFFFQFYRAKQQLLMMLPYDAHDPPKTVVHLRLEDNDNDKRKGLDAESLDALGNLLSSDDETPYLVTNNVAWFDYFERSYHWTHPTWQYVSHSALRTTWGLTALEARKKGLRPEEKKNQRMQLWADWYTVLTAKKVYHTYSDFSMSAIHWAGNAPGTTNKGVTWSRILKGVDPISKELEVSEENWIRDPVIKKVVDRKEDELKHCDGQIDVMAAPSNVISDSIPEVNKNKESETGNPLGLDLSSNVVQNFLKNSLSVNQERMQEFRQWRDKNLNSKYAIEKKHESGEKATTKK